MSNSPASLRDWFFARGDASAAAVMRIAFAGCYLFMLWDLFPVRNLLLAGRDPLVRIEKQPDEDGGYPLLLPGPDGAEVVGRLRLFDEPLVDALNVAIHLFQAPESLAWLLEAAGAVALERCGAILDERTAGGESQDVE